MQKLKVYSNSTLYVSKIISALVAPYFQMINSFRPSIDLNNISIQNGHYLHASSISFLHPRKEKKILFKAQPSKEFGNLFEMIKNEEI